MTNTYTTVNANLNNQRHIVPTPIATRMRQIRQSIRDLEAAGRPTEHYVRALRGLRCPTCANEGDCPDCGAS